MTRENSFFGSIRYISICTTEKFNQCRFLALYHGQTNYLDTKAKCRHLKNLPVKELCAGAGVYLI
jgi:hypothetical protein